MKNIESRKEETRSLRSGREHALIDGRDYDAIKKASRFSNAIHDWSCNCTFL